MAEATYQAWSEKKDVVKKQLGRVLGPKRAVGKTAYRRSFFSVMVCFLGLK